jgi:hypothetical protein
MAVDAPLPDLWPIPMAFALQAVANIAVRRDDGDYRL